MQFHELGRRALLLRRPRSASFRFCDTERRSSGPGKSAVEQHQGRWPEILLISLAPNFARNLDHKRELCEFLIFGQQVAEQG